MKRTEIANGIRELIHAKGADTITLEMDVDSAIRLAADLDWCEQAVRSAFDGKAHLSGSIATP